MLEKGKLTGFQHGGPTLRAIMSARRSVLGLKMGHFTQKITTSGAGGQNRVTQQKLG